MQLRAAREPRIAGIFDVRASARCRRDFVLEACSELHTTLLSSGPVSLFVTTWRLSVLVLGLIIPGPVYPGDAMRTFGISCQNGPSQIPVFCN